MKSCEQVIKEVFQRSEQIQKTKTRKREQLKIGLLSSLVCITFVGTIGICVWRSGQDNKSGIIISSNSNMPKSTVLSTEAAANDSRFQNTQDTDNNSPNADYCPVHNQNYAIREYDEKGVDYDVIVNEGEVYISNVLKKCISENNECFDDGCYQTYLVTMVFYSNGKMVDIDSDFIHNKCTQIFDFIYEKFDKRNCLTGTLEGFQNDSDGKKHNTFEGFMTKAQIESFPSLSDYGIALYLSHNYLNEQVY